jgi:hypothetical protein
MSGGHFNYKQHHIQDIIDGIDHAIETNDKPEEYDCARGLSEQTITRMKHAIGFLRKAQVYAQRIDMLLSGDDGEESFHELLNKELRGLL